MKKIKKARNNFVHPVLQSRVGMDDDTNNFLTRFGFAEVYDMLNNTVNLEDYEKSKFLNHIMTIMGIFTVCNMILDHFKDEVKDIESYDHSLSKLFIIDVIKINKKHYLNYTGDDLTCLKKGYGLLYRNTKSAEQNFYDLGSEPTLDLLQRYEVYIDGLNHINAIDMDWRSKVSIKALKNLKPEDIKFPFNACTVETKTAIWTFVVQSQFDLEDTSMRTVYQNKETKEITNINIYSDKTFEENIKINSDRHKKEMDTSINEEDNYTVETDPYLEGDFILEFFELVSIIMYITVYRENEERIISKTKSYSHSKNNKVKKVSIIKIRDTLKANYKYDYSPIKETKETKTSGVTWKVIGHWRNQRYKEGNKLKWIDPYWKGDGRDILQKIYKVD